MESYQIIQNKSNTDWKVAIVGDVNSGKTALTQCFVENEFPHTYIPTVGADIQRKKVEISNEELVFQLWDCDGSASSRKNNQLYYRHANLYILCTNLADANKFKAVNDWFTEIKHNNNKAKIILVGTKKDLIQEQEEINQLEQSLRQKANDLDPEHAFITDVLITSAKENQGVVEVLTKVSERTMEIKKDFSKRDSAKVETPSKEVKNESNYELKNGKLSFWQRYKSGLIMGGVAIGIVALITIGVTALLGIYCGLLIGIPAAIAVIGESLKPNDEPYPVNKRIVDSHPTETGSSSFSKNSTSSNGSKSNQQISQSANFKGPITVSFQRVSKGVSVKSDADTNTQQEKTYSV